MSKPALVLIDTKTLLCKRYVGRECVLKVQVLPPIRIEDVEIIRNTPDIIPEAPEVA